MNNRLNPVGPLKVEALPLGPFETNAWLLIPERGDLWVVDPGMDPEPLLERLEALGRPLAGILLTHGHLDHAAGCAALVRRHGCPVYAHPADRFLLDGLVEQGAWYGFQLEPVPDGIQPLADGGRLPLGAGELEILHTPGHSPGGLCFRLECDTPLVVCGDTLFAGSFGRVDLPGGNAAALKRSIVLRLFTLPDETVLLPGHGETTTVGRERRGNPILGWDGEDE